MTVLRQILVSCIILIVLLPSLVKVGIMVDYQINQDYIAETLCIQRFDEDSMCSGRCYLSDQLKQANDTEERSTAGNLNLKTELVWLTSYDENKNVRKVPTCTGVEVGLSEVYSGALHIGDVFRPPQFI